MESLRARSLPVGDLCSTGREWVSRVVGAKYNFVASHLYCGRAVTETLQAGNEVGAEVAFLSAGLGIVEQYQKIPAYSLTASSGYPDSVGDRVSGRFDSASWWEALAKAQGIDRPLARFVERRQAGLTVLAVPTSYLGMVSRDLADLSERVVRNLRIIGPRRPDEVHEKLRGSWLPYDGRLDNPKTGMNGTASDFPHRALRHFVSYVLKQNPRGTCESHAADVEAMMSGFSPYIRTRGQSATDDEVKLAILAVWQKHGGRRTQILKELRSDLNIACEQSRFRTLVDQVEVHLNAAT